MDKSKLASESGSSPLISPAKRAKNDRMAFQSRADPQIHAIGRLPGGAVPLAVGRPYDFHEFGCLPENVRISG
jgi:hypothetical protein